MPWPLPTQHRLRVVPWPTWRAAFWPCARASTTNQHARSTGWPQGFRATGIMPSTCSAKVSSTTAPTPRRGLPFPNWPSCALPASPASRPGARSTASGCKASAARRRWRTGGCWPERRRARILRWHAFIWRSSLPKERRRREEPRPRTRAASTCRCTWTFPRTRWPPRRSSARRSWAPRPRPCPRPRRFRRTSDCAVRKSWPMAASIRPCSTSWPCCPRPCLQIWPSSATSPLGWPSTT